MPQFVKWVRYDWRRKAALYAYMPCKQRACVPIAFARAFANNALDDTEVGVFAGHVYRGMTRGKENNGMDRQGAYWGSIADLCRDMGFNYRYVLVKPRYVNERKYWPTAVTFFRGNPGIQIALVGTDAHLAYYERRIGFGLSARDRVQEVWILKEKEQTSERQ